MRPAVFGVLVLVACSPTYAETDTPPDAGPDAAADAGGGDAGPPTACNGKVDCERFVFVSSETSNGKFDDGGLIGADAFCQRLADASSLVRGRKFRAWLSTPATPAHGRVANGTKPYRRPDGVVVQPSLEEFKYAALKAPMNVDENGVIVPTGEVWTGTEADGAPNPLNCNDWTATTQIAEGRQGSATMTDVAWASTATAGCNSMARVYCFEN